MSAGTTPPSSITTERILDAAAEVFAEEGFGGARVEAIAARAGVNKAMLYYHVGDKGELYAAVLARNLAALRATLAAAVDSTTTATDRLRAVISALAALANRLPEHPRIMLREIAAGGANLPAAVAGQISELLATVRGVLEEGVQAGQLRAVNPFLTYLLVVGSVTFMTAALPISERLQTLGIPIERRESLLDVAHFLADVLLNGLTEPGGRS